MAGLLVKLLQAVVLVCVATTARAATEYEYDDAGRLQRTYTDGGDQVDYGLDAAGNRQALQITADSRGDVSFTSSTRSVTEGDSGTKSVLLSVTRSGDTTRAAQARCISLPSQGSANASEDYTPVDQMLSWSAGHFRVRVRCSAASPTRESGDPRALRCRRYHVRNRPAGPRCCEPASPRQISIRVSFPRLAEGLC